MSGCVGDPKPRQKLSTRHLATAAVSAATVCVGAAAAATPADAAYYNGCAVPKQDHGGHGAFFDIDNKGHAWAACQAGGTGNGTPCITLKGQMGSIIVHNGWYYCSGGTGGTVYSSCSHCNGSSVMYPIVRLSGGHNTTHNHHLSGNQSY